MKVAFLEYVFMFDPGDVWSHLSEFESFLTKALKDVDLEGELVNVVGGQSGRGVIYIKKKEMIAIPEESGRPKTIKGQFKDLRERKFRAPAKRFQAKRPDRKLRGFDRVIRKAGG